MYRYKILFHSSESVIIDRDEPMTQADIHEYCRLVQKKYLTHYPIHQLQEVELTVKFRCTMPYDEIVCTLADLENFKDMLQFGFAPPLQAFYDKLLAWKKTADLIKCGDNDCEHHKIDMLTGIQMTKLVRLLKDWDDEDISHLIEAMFKMCWYNMKALIHEYMDNYHGGSYNDIDTLADAIVEIMK